MDKGLDGLERSIFKARLWLPPLELFQLVQSINLEDLAERLGVTLISGDVDVRTGGHLIAKIISDEGRTFELRVRFMEVKLGIGISYTNEILSEDSVVESSSGRWSLDSEASDATWFTLVETRMTGKPVLGTTTVDYFIEWLRPLMIT